MRMHSTHHFEKEGYMEPTKQAVTLAPLNPEDENQFVLDNQEAFN